MSWYLLKKKGWQLQKNLLLGFVSCTTMSVWIILSAHIFLPLLHHLHVLHGHHCGLPGKLSWSDWSPLHFHPQCFLSWPETESFRNKMQCFVCVMLEVATKMKQTTAQNSITNLLTGNTWRTALWTWGHSQSSLTAKIEYSYWMASNNLKKKKNPS